MEENSSPSERSEHVIVSTVGNYHYSIFLEPLLKRLFLKARSDERKPVNPFSVPKAEELRPPLNALCSCLYEWKSPLGDPKDSSRKPLSGMFFLCPNNSQVGCN